MKRYVIERNVEGMGAASEEDLRRAAAESNAALAELAPRVQWQQSFVTEGGTYCVYLAEDEAAIREHARIAGVPADKITEVKAAIDPLTAEG